MFSRIYFSLYVVIRTLISGHKNVKFQNKLNHQFSHYNLYTHSTWAQGKISTIKFIRCVWDHFFFKCNNVMSWIVFRVVWHTYDENNNINKMLYAQKTEDAFAICNPFIRVLEFCIHCSRRTMRRRFEFLWISQFESYSIKLNNSCFYSYVPSYHKYTWYCKTKYQQI